MCFAQAVYTALKETEQRATDVLPLWKLPFLHPLIPRQRKAAEAVELIRETTEQLIAKCRAMVDAEEQVRPSTHGGSCLSCTRSSRAGAKLLRPWSSSGRQQRSSLPSAKPRWTFSRSTMVQQTAHLPWCLPRHACAPQNAPGAPQRLANVPQCRETDSALTGISLCLQ